MRVITGDECGIVKECLPELLDEKKAVRRINSGETVARKHGCVDLCWVDQQQQQDAAFASLSMSGVCSVWERLASDGSSSLKETSFGKYRKRCQIANIFQNTEGHLHPSTNPIGIFALQQDNRLAACNAAGRVSILNTAKDEVVHTFDTFKLTDQDDTKQALVTSCTVHAAENRVAVGGQERDVMIWDLATGKESWKAKNARPDPQTLLQQQVWPTCISFIDSNIVAVGSAHCEVRLYDIRQQRRPIALTPKGMWEHRITAICPLSKESNNKSNTLVIGDSAGFLQSMDWRNNLKQITGRFMGPAGSIRKVVSHPTESRIAVVGLDRMLRIYDCNTRKQLQCMYMRQRLNCVLFGLDSSNDQASGQDGTTKEGDGEWDQDDQIEDYVNSDDEAPKLEDDEDTQGNNSKSESEQEDGEGGDNQFDEHGAVASDSESDSDSSASDGRDGSDDDAKRKPTKRPKRK